MTALPVETEYSHSPGGAGKCFSKQSNHILMPERQSVKNISNRKQDKHKERRLAERRASLCPRRAPHGKSLQKCFREKSKKRYAFYERCDKIEDTRKEIGGDAP